jgi:uncharacterized membrane protein (UPF0127 family)
MALLLALCLQMPAFAERHMVLPTDPAPLVAETQSGQQRFSIEIADEERERAAGLMFRTEMQDSHGMLFVFEATRPVGFWMKNTPMPLDLVFIGEDGRVRAVLPGEPFSEALITPDVPVRFVLELKRGIAQKAGIAPGDRIRHPAIDAMADHN